MSPKPVLHSGLERILKATHNQVSVTTFIGVYKVWQCIYQTLLVLVLSI